MKKYNKLFAILFAVLGVTTLKAQTNIIADWDGGSNTGKPTTFGWASSYGSRSWGALNGGGGARVTNTYSGYKKEDGSAYSYVADSEPSTQILWIRYNSNSETYTYTFQGLEAGKVYTFSGLVGWHNNSNAPTFTITVNGDKELAKVSKYCGTKQMLYPFSVDFYVPSDNTSEDFTLKFNSNQGGDNMEALSALSIVENADFANASESTPYDATSWLSNPGFENVSGGAGSINTPSGWTIKHSLSGWLDGTGNTAAPSEGSKCYNIWAGTVNSIDMYQTVTLPAGKYEVLADLRIDNMSLVTDQGVYAKVGGIVSKSGTIQTVASPWNSLEGWNTLTTTFNNGSESDVVIGISSTGTGSGSAGWFQADNVRLMYLGYDLTEANKALEALIEAAQKIIDANEVSPKSIEKLNQAIAAAQSVEQTEEAIAQASENLSRAMTAADETKEACAEYRSILALSESMYTNSTADDKSTFKAAIDKAKDDFNAAENSEAIRTISVELQNAQKAYCLVAAPTEGHPFDMTHLIVNPHFDQDKTGWTSDGGAQNKAIATNKTNGIIEGKFFENWNPSSFTGSIYQIIEGLPSGTYLFKAAAFGNGAQVFANDAYIQITSDDGAWYEVEVKINDGTLKFGVQNNNNTGWMGIDNVSLQFIAALDLSEFISAYEAALASAVAARDNAEYTHITGIERTNLVNAIDQPIAEETKEAYQEATQSLANATNAFIAAKSDYDILAAEIIIAKGLGMTDDRINGITAGKTGAVAYPDLKVDEYNYIIEEIYTESATLGSWTEDFAEDLNGEGYKANGSTYFNEWGNATRTAKQTVKLPAGDYAISSIGRGQSGTSGYLYYKIGDTTNQVDFIMKGNRGRGVDVDGVATFSDEATYNCNGEGFGWEYRFITFHLDAETEVEIGVSATFANAWVSIYAPVLLTDPSSKKALLLSQIASLLENVPSGIMNKDVETTLNTKKTVAQNASNANTTVELDEIYTEFKNAVDAANTSIADYAAILTYIDKANNIDGSIAAAYKTQYDDRTLAESAETVFQKLEVATYNYVTENFNYAVPISSTWNSTGTNTTAKEFSNEHWSGETRGYMNQNDDNGQGWNANAWSLDFDQDVTLPAGEYVFKVAGRKSAGATLQLVVTMGETTLGTVSDFPNGNASLGITKTGEASFDPEDPAGFANNGAGFGWQWRYVKFTLDAEATTVKIAVHAETNAAHNWVSFGDYTLQMTEETYLEANKGGLDAPTAAAEALVDSKPMGTEENDALKEALALPVTTGAELLAKIEALNIAVANANAWIPKYNEAKAPLVAALERFETDYNDAENGALDYMCKSRWAKAVNMAQAAAVAKDVTDSYEGFATATENLVAALDAATVSVGEYAALKTAIDEATLYLNGNDWGSDPFQKPESAKDDFNTIKTTAQNAYDAAEVDGEGVTAVIESLSTAVNDVVLNAPVEGQRFYIKVATEGHANAGNAILATLGNTDANNPTGYRLNTDNEAKGYLAQAFIFTQVEGNLYNISIERPESTVYLTYGSLNGSAAGWKNQQIQATTDAEKKGEFKIVPTGQNGILKIFNTVDNNYIDCQAGGAIYTDTGISNEEFAFELAPEHEVALSITSAGWATLILPFNAEIPEDVVAYTSEEVADYGNGDAVQLIEAESFVANTPYLVSGVTGSYVFSGYGMAEKDSYTVGLFTGTYVEYQTTANSNTYVLQKHNDEVAFYLVGESVQPVVNPYRMYMTYPKAAGAPMFRIGRGTTGIEDAEWTMDNGQWTIYDLMGRKVTTMEKGNMYIVNGKKVIVK